MFTYTTDIGPLIAKILLSASHALAAYTPGGAITTVAGADLPSAVGTTNFGVLLVAITNAFTPLVYIVAGFIAMRAALLFIIEQSEDQLEQFKQAIIGSLIAIVLINIAGVLSSALFTGVGDIPDLSAANAIKQEINGFINFIEEPVAVIAIVMIIVSGIRTVLSYGSGDMLTHLQRTVISVLTGIFLIVIKTTVSSTVIVQHSPDSLIAEIIKIVKILLGFVTIIAVVVIIWAGLLMIVNVGNDEQYKRAKGIIIRVAIGLLVILSSAAIADVVLV